MTDAQVTALLDVELMTNGVKKPVAPTLIEIPKCPIGDKVKRFAVHYKGRYGSDDKAGCVFNTLEQAQAFIDMCPCFQDYDYEVGSEFQYLKPMVESKIAVEEFYTQEQVNEFRNELKGRKSKTEANQKAQSEFNAACAKSEEITRGVWNDWSKKRELRGSLQQIVVTLKEYIKLSDGDQPVAMKFLEKAYTAEEIAQAKEWFPTEFPPTQPTAEPAKE